MNIGDVVTDPNEIRLLHFVRKLTDEQMAGLLVLMQTLKTGADPYEPALAFLRTLQVKERSAKKRAGQLAASLQGN